MDELKRLQEWLWVDPSWRSASDLRVCPDGYTIKLEHLKRGTVKSVRGYGRTMAEAVRDALSKAV